jgi:hypothetical protein
MSPETIINPIPTVSKLLHELDYLGYEATLIGGTALILLGSQRVTKDADFLMVKSAREQREFIQAFYKHGFQLISKLNDKKEVVRTIDNANVAFARLQIDEPVSVFFYNHKVQFRVDALFDFPYSAAEVRSRATKKKIEGTVIHIASIEDLIRMKKIAYKNRKKSSDLQDLEFLKSLK